MHGIEAFRVNKQFQDVVYRLQQYFERDVDPPVASELDRGDFSIFVDGVNKRDLGTGLVRTAVPTAFPGSGGLETGSRPTSFSYQPQTVDDLMSGSPFDRITPVEQPKSQPGSRPNSMDVEIRPRPSFSSSISVSAIAGSSRSVPGSPLVEQEFRNEVGGPSAAHSPSGSVSSMASVMGESSGRLNSLGNGFPLEFFPKSQLLHSRPSTSGTSGPPAARKPKPNYSWNEIVDRENLGVRPGEVEILPKDFETMYVQSFRKSLGNVQLTW